MTAWATMQTDEFVRRIFSKNEYQHKNLYQYEYKGLDLQNFKTKEDKFLEYIKSEPLQKKVASRLQRLYQEYWELLETHNKLYYFFQIGKLDEDKMIFLENFVSVPGLIAHQAQFKGTEKFTFCEEIVPQPSRYSHYTKPDKKIWFNIKSGLGCPKCATTKFVYTFYKEPDLDREFATRECFREFGEFNIISENCGFNTIFVGLRTTDDGQLEKTQKYIRSVQEEFDYFHKKHLKNE